VLISSAGAIELVLDAYKNCTKGSEQPFFFSTTHNVIKVGVQNQTSLTRAMVRGFLEFLLFLFSSIRHALLLLVTPLKIGAKT